MSGQPKCLHLNWEYCVTYFHKEDIDHCVKCDEILSNPANCFICIDCNQPSYMCLSCGSTWLEKIKPDIKKMIKNKLKYYDDLIDQ